MTAFIHNLKLQSILAYALRTVYAINSAKIPLGFGGDDWEARTSMWSHLFGVGRQRF